MYDASDVAVASHITYHFLRSKVMIVGSIIRLTSATKICLYATSGTSTISTSHAIDTRMTST